MDKLERFAPPGKDLSGWRIYITVTVLLAALYAVVVYINNLFGALDELYIPFTKELVEDARMWDYDYVLGSTMGGFEVFALGMAAFVADFYLYYFRDSKSIYTMARIRSPWELHMRSWTVPLLGVGGLYVGKWLLTVIFFVFYVLATPQGLPKPGFDQLIRGLVL